MPSTHIVHVPCGRFPRLIAAGLRTHGYPVGSQIPVSGTIKDAEAVVARLAFLDVTGCTITRA